MYIVSGTIPSLLILVFVISKLERKLFLMISFGSLAILEFFMSMSSNVLPVR